MRHRLLILTLLCATQTALPTVLAVGAQDIPQRSSTDPFQLGPVPATVDLRNMVREHIVRRSCELLEAGASRRMESFRSGRWTAWRDNVRRAVLRQMGPMPFGADGPPLNIRLVSRHEFPHCDVENVLFESLAEWDVNASVFLPKEDEFPPPWKAIVVPVGHSAKVRENYQIPAQAFARLGYVAVIFDPPGMAGEKREGNDHFSDGVRCYLTGHSSNRYFVIDAIRCIDYLETREDVDLSDGVGMTGVSGGGTTTMYATLLDERIRASGPSCCAVPNAHHPVLDGYAPCAETLAAGRFSAGIDSIDLLCAALPTPVLLMCGEKDEVFKIEWSRQISEQVRNAFESAEYGERYDFYADPSGHAYTVEMAERFAKWMDRWVGESSERENPELSEDDFEMIPAELLACHPRLEGNMFSLNMAMAETLRRKRSHPSSTDVRESVVRLVGVDRPIAIPGARVGVPFQVWFHNLQEMLLQPEVGIELPATFLVPTGADWGGGAVLHFDDRGRWAELRRGGAIAGIAGFIQQGPERLAAMTVDLRGWGDTAPAYLPYEIAGWGDRSRWIAYVSAAMGDPILAMRIRDGLSALTYLREREEINPDRIVVGGHGMGGVVALHVAAIDGRTAGAFSVDGLASFESLAASTNYSWSHEDFFPGVLAEYDLPQLVASLGTSVLVANPLDADQQPLERREAEALYVDALQDGESFQLVTEGSGYDSVRRFVRERARAQD